MVEQWIFGFLGACVFLWGSSCQEISFASGDASSRIAAVVKTDLAKTYFRQNVRRPPKLRLNEKERKAFELNRKGEGPAVFGSSNRSYVFDGEKIFRLEGKEKSTGRDFSLEDVPGLLPEENPVLFRNYLYQQSESEKLRFVVICYRKGYCQVLVSAEEGSDGFKLQIATGIPPSDVRFFPDRDDLLLIVVKDPCLVYRWTGTYFDQQDVLDTTGARSVAAFRRGKNSVFVVAQNLGTQKVHSKVYVRKDKRMELIQLLPTSNALKAEPLRVKNGEDHLDLVFVLNEMRSSSIYWWNGRELSLWKSVDDVLGNGLLHVDHVLSETFLFFSNKNELRVYRSTPMDFDLVLILTFDSDVLDFELIRGNGAFSVLLVLTGFESDPFLKLVTIRMEMDTLPVAENQRKEKDQIFECYKQLKERLSARDGKLSRGWKTAEVFSRGDPISFLTAEETFVDVADVERLSIDSFDRTSDETLTEAKERIAESEKRIGSVRNASDPADKIYRVRGETKLGKLKANRISVEKLGGESFRSGNFLSLTKNQNLGRTKAGKFSAENLNVGSVVGVDRRVDAKDILTKNKPRQEIAGEQTLKSLRARSIRFAEGGKVNGILFRDLVTRSDSENPVTGNKVFAKFRTQNLGVGKIDGISSEDWSRKILPGFKNGTEDDAALDFSRLNVENLKISYLNDVPWEELEDSLLFPGGGVALLRGSLFCPGKTKVGSLRTAEINGIPPEEFFTATTNQKLDSGLMAPSATAEKIKPATVNGEDDPRLKEILENDAAASDGLDRSVDTVRTEEYRGNYRVSNVVFKKPADISGRSVDPETMKTEFYCKREPQEILIPVDFKKTVTVTKNLRTEEIGGKLFDSFAFVDGSAPIRPGCVFRNATAYGNVTVSEKAVRNVDLRALESNAAKSTGENLVSGRKRFDGPVVSKTLKTRFLETFAPEESYMVEELIVYGNASVRNETDIREINGLSFDDTVSNLLLANDSSLLEYGSHSSLLVKNLDVERLNGLETPSETETGIELSFEGILRAPEIRARNINGLDFDRYVGLIVPKNESRISIRGRKRFVEKTKIFGDLNGTLDGYDAADLEKRALSRTKPQNVTGIYRVDDAKANALFAKTVDGIQTEDLIFPDDSVIDSDLVFDDLIVAGNVRSSDFMDGCDLNKIAEKNLEAVQNFGSLYAKEDFAWKSGSGNLSRFFSDAVTSDKDGESVTGSIAFKGHVFADRVRTKHDVDDIDLKTIVENAVYRSSPKQEISSDVIFKGNVTAENVLVLKNTIVDHVDGVDILDFDSKIVRRDGDVQIEGKKEFRNGFSTENLYADRIDGLSTEGIIFYDDQKMMPSTTFRSFKVSENLEVGEVDGVDLEDLTDRRWSKSKDAVLSGNVTVKGNVRFRDDARISRIDDIEIEKVVPLESENVETIRGKVEFRNSVSVDGKIESENVDGHDLARIKNQSFTRGETVDISRNIVFSENITAAGDVEVSARINGKDRAALENAETRPERDGTVSERKEIKDVVERSKNLSSPSIFLYLERISTLDLDYSVLAGSDSVTYGNSAEIRVEGFGERSHEDCPRLVQSRISISSAGKLSIDKDVPRKFKFYDPESGTEATVKTSAVSHDPRCSGSETEVTVVTWNATESSGTANLGGGHVDDVKFFRLGDSIYVVVSYSYALERVGTVVYEVITSDGKVAEVDRVDDSRAFEVFWTPEGVVMVTGNRTQDCVAVRRFVESDNKFSLLRIVPTHGVTAVKSARHKKENFIFVVQKSSWPLLILKYDPTEDNYRVREKRDTAEADLGADFLSVAPVSASGRSDIGDEDMFLGVVLSDESFGLFKYKHVEGFVEILIQEQENVKLLEPFRIGTDRYLLAVSSLRPSAIYKFVKQGRT